MNVKPLSDRVLILPNPAEEKTAGGLIIPDTAKEKPLAGKVVAVGPGTSEVKMEVKEGDQVLYGKYAGQEIQVDGVDYEAAGYSGYHLISSVGLKKLRLWQKR
jgi:chaperonin GroES